MPSYIELEIDCKLLPSIIDELLDVSRLAKANYSSTDYQSIIKNVPEESTIEKFDFKRFAEGDLAVLIDYITTVKNAVWDEKKAQGKKVRKVEDKENIQGKLFPKK